MDSQQPEQQEAPVWRDRLGFTKEELARLHKRTRNIKENKAKGIIDYKEAPPVPADWQPNHIRYDWKKAEMLYFQKRKPDGTPYSLAEVAEMFDPPIPLKSITNRSAKHKPTWGQRRKVLLELEREAARKAKEEIYSAQGTIAAQRRQQREMAQGLGLQVPEEQEDVLADLEQRYLTAIKNATTEEGAKAAIALGNLLKQARGICTPPDGTPDDIFPDDPHDHGDVDAIRARASAFDAPKNLTGPLAESDRVDAA